MFKQKVSILMHILCLFCACNCILVYYCIYKNIFCIF